MTRRRWYSLQATLLLGMGGVAFCALNIGPSPVTLFQILSATDVAILWQARLPRILLALAVGMALGGAGASYQALLRNPLADPYILGVSGGAALGSAIGIGAGLPFPFIALAAFVASLGTIGLILMIARGDAVHTTYRLLLTGVVCNAFAFACIMAVQAVIPIERSHEILVVLMGNLTLADLQITWWVFGIVIVGLIILMRHARALDAWTLGAETAASLGIDPARLQRTIFLAGSLVVGASVAASGLIGFVGLIVPHAARLIVGHRHHLLLPLSACGGGVFLVVADTVARSALHGGDYTTELPVGVVTALVGAPLFLWLLRKRTA
ncbi:MAG: iron ABC transporter permease [Deltaproteobacteria bacterium]|nr:iron ABC transporter permease [Deltaproteobacteria bacterium]